MNEAGPEAEHRAAARTCRVRVDLDGELLSPLTAARLLLVADVVARVHTVLHHQPVSCVAVTQAERPALPIHPDVGRPSALQRAATVEGAADLLGGEPDIIIVPTPMPAVEQTPCRSRRLQTIHVAPVIPTPSAASAVRTDDEHERCATRLMLLHFPPGSPAHITLPRRRRADETLDRWRLKVAMWEEMPVAPPDAGVLTALVDALEAGLNTQRTLVMLHRLEADLRVPSGAKYAVFRSVDRILDLDLGHLVGKLRH